jgi:protein-S-isoprenylcysteine O-methyltransferase Ste14
VGALLPFALLTSAPHPAVRDHPFALYAAFWWMTLATGLTVWGMWTVRRSFSITVEARELVEHGPYRWIRHPIYCGEILAAAAVCAWRFSWPNVGLFALFTIIQLARARWEEQKLSKRFPAYGTAKAWWLWRLH